MSSQPVPFKRPFPALTPAQRYHFDAMGYVVVPNTIDHDRCDRINEAMHRLRADLWKVNPEGGTKHTVEGAFFVVNQPHHVFMNNMYDYDDQILSYSCDPKMVGMAEEVMGCEARILEFNCHLNSKVPGSDFSKPARYGFHHGVDALFGSHVQNGLYHCNFVKSLSNLTDLGPDDGGTVVVAGSHKFLDVEAAIAAAYEDTSLIHQVVAPKGSTLLFAETLIHGTGQIRSDKERAIIITGYGPRMYPRWDGAEQSREYAYPERFAKRVPESLKTLYFGYAHWNRAPRYRKLSEPLDAAAYAPVPWPER